MANELKEFRDICDGESELGGITGKPPTEDELTRALQVLLVRQCVHSSTPGIGRTYEIVKGYAQFFSRYFAALGYHLVVNARDQTVAVSVPKDMSRYDAIYKRLRKDETIVLLALRLMWDQAVAEGEFGDGGVLSTSTGDLVDKITVVTGKNPPEETGLTDILRLFQRHGAVRIGKRDPETKALQLTILPGVAVIAPDDYVAEVKRWAASSSIETPGLENVEELA